MMRSLVPITIGYSKPGETSGRPGLSPAQVLLGPAKHCTCDKDPPLVKSSLLPLPTGRRLIFISMGVSRRHRRKSSPRFNYICQLLTRPGCCQTPKLDTCLTSMRVGKHTPSPRATPPPLVPPAPLPQTLIGKINTQNCV